MHKALRTVLETVVRRLAMVLPPYAFDPAGPVHESSVFLDCFDGILWNVREVPALHFDADPLMTDIVDRTVRSRMMAGISGRNTKPEMILRLALHGRGYRYRLHDRKLPGSPDLVFPRYGAVCFVHGCFWHRHKGCPYTTDPATRPDFWQAKFKANVERDRRVRDELLEAGWRMAVVWECALRKDAAERTLSALDQWLRGSERSFETPLDWIRQSHR